MYYVRLKDDKHKRRWKVRQAVSLQAAYNCIIEAMVTGSIGGTDYTVKYPFGLSGPRHEVVTADVIRVNSDNTEAEPYKAAY